MAQKNTERAERVTLVHAVRGTKITVGAALASRMSGYRSAKTAAADDGTPSDSWTATKLKAYAAENDIDLAGATRKADILDAIAATVDPDNDDDGQDDEDDDLDGPDDENE
jgi:hypothetical protein